MRAITAVDPDTATGEARELFDTVERSIKRIPNMMRLLANSPPVLAAYIRFNEAISKTVLVGTSIDFPLVRTGRAAQVNA